MNVNKLVNRRFYFFQLAANVLSVIAILPYIVTVQADLLNTAPIPLPMNGSISINNSKHHTVLGQMAGSSNVGAFFNRYCTLCYSTCFNIVLVRFVSAIIEFRPGAISIS